MRAAPEQRVGFLVSGTINDSLDLIDTFSFTSSESRTLRVQLCVAGNICGATYRLGVATAFIEVRDQFGTMLWTTEDNQAVGNVLTIGADSGVLYCIAVVAENTSGNDMGYFLNVVETSDPADPMTPQAVIPSAPLLSVSGAPSQTVTLDWVAPMTNTDGSALLDLSGYTISYADVSGPCCGNYPTTEIDLDNPGLVTYVLDLPSPGDWTISVTARNSAGQVSVASNSVTVTVDDPWLIAAPGQVVSYHFSTGVMSGSTDPALASLLSGTTVSATFDYDNGVPATSGWEFTEYQGGLSSLSGVVGGSSFSDVGGSAIVSDGRYGPPAVYDMLQLSTGPMNFSGFDAGGYRLVGVRIFWAEGQNGILDFLTNENLPTALPGFEGRLALDFTPTATPGVLTSVFFDSVFVTPTG
jgi:hypothetical protein